MLPFLIGAVTAASSAAQLVGAFQSASGYNTVAEGEKEQAQAQLKAERIRQKQMRLDFMRAKRESIRQAIVLRSQVLAEATAKGASQGDSSVQAGIDGVQTQLGRNLVSLKQNKAVGKSLFAANLDYYQAGTKIAEGQGQIAASQGISNIGSALGNSIGPISRLGSLFSGG